MSLDQLIGKIGKVLVVDDEQSNLMMIKNYLKQQNQFDVQTFRNGADAWERLRGIEYDFVIMGWRLKDITGIAFLNRLRRLPDNITMPVLVTSGMINRNDFRLLAEFPCTGLLESPFTRGQFEKAIENLLREKVWYQNNQETVRTVIKSARGQGEQVDSQIRKILETAPNPGPLAVLTGKSLVAAGLYGEAQRILSAVLLKSPSNVAGINELAKIHCRNREYNKAYDLLRHARDLSPHNMQRICTLGEVSLSMRDPEGARRFFDEALEIDKDDETAQAGVSISTTMLEFPGNITGVAMTASFASLLNTIGIAFVRNGNFERGVVQYESAMMFLREKLDLAKVAFNLGLCYMRWGKRSEALPWFEKCHMYAGGQLNAGNYIQSLKQLLGHKFEELPAKNSQVVNGGLVSEFSFTDRARRLAKEHEDRLKKNAASTIIEFEDDDLEERVGSSKGVALTKKAAEQVLNLSLEEIEGMELIDLDESA